MAELSWGVKRTCQGCGERFYDLGKVPTPCPHCGVVFEFMVTQKKKGRSNKDILPVDDLVIDDSDISVVDDDPVLLDDEDHADAGFIVSDDDDIVD